MYWYWLWELVSFCLFLLIRNGWYRVCFICTWELKIIKWFAVLCDVIPWLCCNISYSPILLPTTLSTPNTLRRTEIVCSQDATNRTAPIKHKELLKLLQLLKSHSPSSLCLWPLSASWGGFCLTLAKYMPATTDPLLSLFRFPFLHLGWSDTPPTDGGLLKPTICSAQKIPG